jgi:hypothetical protein
MIFEITAKNVFIIVKEFDYKVTFFTIYVRGVYQRKRNVYLLILFKKDGFIYFLVQ